MSNGSYIERAADSGNRLGTPASNWSLKQALFIGVPSGATMANILSRLISLLPACTAFGTWYWSSTITLILRPLMPPASLTSSKRIFTAFDDDTP